MNSRQWPVAGGQTETGNWLLETGNSPLATEDCLFQMREETARTVANIVLGAAAIGAAVVILRVPVLRRLAFGLARTAITTGIPAWIAREVGTAWAASERPRGSAA